MIPSFYALKSVSASGFLKKPKFFVSQKTEDALANLDLVALPSHECK